MKLNLKAITSCILIYFCRKIKKNKNNNSISINFWSKNRFNKQQMYKY